MRCVPIAVTSYRDLIAWQKAIDLVTEIYLCTRSFPREETYGLVSQLRRAAVSVPSNISEGHARLSTGEFRQFIGHALGSLMEIETQLLISERLNLVDSRRSADLLSRTSEIGKILNGLLQSLSNKSIDRAGGRHETTGP